MTHTNFKTNQVTIQVSCGYAPQPPQGEFKIRINLSPPSGDLGGEMLGREQLLNKLLKSGMMCIALLLLFSPLLTNQPSAAFNPGLVNISAGSWTVFPKNSSPLFFNKLSAAWYMTLNGWKLTPVIPVAWTYESNANRQRIFLGDGSFIAGRKIGKIELRAGLVIPLGYGLSSEWKQNAWIGTNNLKVQAGVAAGRSDDEIDGLPYSVEFIVSTPLTEKNSYTRRGSLSSSIYAKTYWMAHERIRLGLEAALLAGQTIWDWTYESSSGHIDNVIETGFSAIPHVWGEYRLNQSFFFSVKAGFGPNFKYSNQYPDFKYSGSSLNMGAGLQWYP